MTQKLFLDANIALDLLGERAPHYDAAAKIASLADRKSIKIAVSALSFPIVHYVLQKFEPVQKVKDKLQKFKILVETASLNESIIDKAFNSKFEDFEDALQYFCALQVGCNVLVTRNISDFKHADIPVMTGEAFLSSIGKR